MKDHSSDQAEERTARETGPTLATGGREGPTAPNVSAGPGITASRRRLLHAIGAAGIVGVAGCTQESGDGTTPGTEQDDGMATDTERERKQSVTIGTTSTIHRNFWSLSIFTRTFEPLVGYDHTLQPTPWLAEEWERIDEDTWEFTLRDGITYHNGDDLTAETVVARTHRWLSDADWVTEPSGINTTAEGLETVDDRTFRMTTIEPDAHQYENLLEVKTFGAHPDGPKRFPEKFENLIGTGPFEIDEIEKEQFTRALAFDDYWGGNPQSSGPHVDELTVRPFKDRNTMALSLEGKEIDVAVDLPPSRKESVKRTSGMKTATQTQSMTASLHINLQTEPTSDPKFRQALNYALSQEEIVTATQNGLGIPARGELPPMYYMSAHDDLPTYGPDPAKAKQLLEESVYDGETLEYVTTADTPRGGKLIAELVKEAFGEIGVDVDIQVVGGSAAGDRRRNGDGHLFAYTRWLNFLGEFVHAVRMFGSAEGGLEEADNPDNQPRQEVRDRLDPLIATAKSASGTERANAMREIQQIIMAEGLRIPLFHQKYLVGMRSGIEGVNWHPVRTSTRTEDLEYFV